MLLFTLPSIEFQLYIVGMRDSIDARAIWCTVRAVSMVTGTVQEFFLNIFEPIWALFFHY